MTKEAVVLAAGRANRLLPLTERRPKAMLLVGGRPLLQSTVEALVANGVEQAVVVVGEHAPKIQAFLKDGSDFGLRVEYAPQTEPRGTADALRAALPHLDGREVLVVPANAHLRPAAVRPLARATAPAVLLATARDARPASVPELKGGRLRGYVEAEPVPGSTYVATGLLRADAGLLDALANGNAHRLEDVVSSHAASHDVHAVTTDEPWSPVVDPWDLLRLNERVLDTLPKPDVRARAGSVRGTVQVGRNSTIAPTASLIGPVTIGEGCSIGDHTVVGPYVSIRNSSAVGAHCEVRHSIVNNNVLIDSRSLVRGCILDDGVQVAAGFLCDAIPADDGPRGCIIGRDATTAPGVLVPGGTVVAPEGRLG